MRGLFECVGRTWKSRGSAGGQIEQSTTDRIDSPHQEPKSVCLAGSLGVGSSETGAASPDDRRKHSVRCRPIPRAMETREPRPEWETLPRALALLRAGKTE